MIPKGSELWHKVLGEHFTGNQPADPVLHTGLARGIPLDPQQPETLGAIGWHQFANQEGQQASEARQGLRIIAPPEIFA